MNQEELIAGWAGLWAPSERLPLSQWAEKNFHLSPEYSARTGIVTLYGWQREPFDAFTDPSVQTLVLMCGVQMLKTLLMQVAMAYAIAEAPGPILFSQYKDGDVKKFSKERLDPMLRDCPVLHGKVFGGRRDPGNTIEYKRFVGGNVTLVGSLSPANFAGRSIRYYFGDEVDKYPLSVGIEGDAVDLAVQRTSTYQSQKKIILACSPTIGGRSRIANAYAASDQRKPWVPCPKCGAPQILTWAQVKFDKGGSVAKRASTARYQCNRCSERWNDVERVNACEKSKWVAENQFEGSAGFWISHLYSPWKTLSEVTREFLNAKGHRERMVSWTNATMAELYEEAGEAPDSKRLYDRREYHQIGVVPHGGLLLILTADIQADRIEAEVVAFGRNREKWSVYYEVIQPTRMDSAGNTVPCRTSEPEPWARLKELIDMDWPCEGGGSVSILAAGIDTGYNSDPVYEFCRKYPQPAHGPSGSTVNSYRTVVPIKGGHSQYKLIEGVSDTDAARKRSGLRIVTVGSSYAKQQVFDALQLESPVDGGEYPKGYYHLPDYEYSYFEGLTAETRVVRGGGEVAWRRTGRNEPLDLAAYQLAISELCGVSRWAEAQWSEMERRIEATRPNPQYSLPASQQDQSQQPQRKVFARFRV